MKSLIITFGMMLALWMSQSFATDVWGSDQAFITILDNLE